eukprot:Tamp_37382.p1 GENE.Tamp_37382~~Tamp_37382.p1  ORF type:complete len:130 (-),score=10.01 Tamp_37382:85-474(-)
MASSLGSAVALAVHLSVHCFSFESTFLLLLLLLLLFLLSLRPPLLIPSIIVRSARGFLCFLAVHLRDRTWPPSSSSPPPPRALPPIRIPVLVSHELFSPPDSLSLDRATEPSSRCPHVKERMRIASKEM